MRLLGLFRWIKIMVIKPTILIEFYNSSKDRIEFYHYGDYDISGPTHIYWQTNGGLTSYGPFKTLEDAVTNFNGSLHARPRIELAPVVPINHRSAVIHVDFKTRKRL